MKKQYKAPALINHGSVESITQLFGSSTRKDFLFFSAAAANTANPGLNATGPVASGITSQGSVDSIVKLCGEPGANCSTP